MAKIFTSNFITGLGKHTPASFGTDLGINKILKASKEGVINEDIFNKMHDYASKAEVAYKFMNFAGKLVGSIVDNGENSPLHNKVNKIPLLSCNSCTPNAKNNSVYMKTVTHVGLPTNRRINRIKGGPFMETLTKTITATNCDYQEHEKRKNLWLNCGFNQKGHCFLMEDTYFTVDDYLKMYKVNEKYKDEFSINHKGVKNIYGCVLNTRHIIKIRSRMEFYDAKLKIHLVKITDINSDVRSLIKDFTNNSEQKIYSSSGKIPKDEQLNEPEFKKRNKATLSFLTIPETFIKSCNKFTERARIVRTWNRTLTSGSTWEFDMTHYLGGGAHLNTMFDMKNQEHPSGFVFYIEYLGDNRASLRHNTTGDVHMGYGPCNLFLEFEKRMCYITNQNDEENLVVTKLSRNETDFEEEGEFFGLFHPDRKTRFNVNYFDLMGENKKSEYTLEYDQFNVNSNEIKNILKSVKEEFAKNGLEPEDATEDDIALNLNKDPNESDNLNGPTFSYLRGSEQPEENKEEVEDI
jgi:hypothetical protein